MGETTEDAILEAVLEGLRAGREPDRAGLVLRFPEHTEQIDRVLRTARRYARATRQQSADRSGAPLLEVGRRIGDFEIQGFLGSGGMGQVFRACQLSLGRREVALKVAPARLLSEEGRRRFQREGLLLAGLHHPNLAEVYGLGEQEGLLFLAMSLVEGRTLRDVQSDLAPGGGRPDVAARRRVMGWAMDLASALQLVHAHGLVHRDVKPTNVVIDERTGRAVLVDFGLARRERADTMTRGTPATMHYAPPEQILGGRVTARSDVFALGVTVHDLLTGRLPEDRGPASAGLEPLDALLPDADPDLVAVLARAVDPDARWRYADASELHADLAAWLGGRKVSARRRSWPERARRAFTDHPERFVRASFLALWIGLFAVGAARSSAWIDAAHRAELGYAQGDLLQLSRSVAGVPAPLRRLLVGAEVRELAARLDAAAEGDVLPAVVEALAADEVTAATLAAATRLRVDGLASDPQLLWFLEQTLRRAIAGPGGADELRGDVLRLVARLCYERPVETPRAAAATAGLRALLRDAWRDPRLPEMDRLYALSALGGCGTGADLTPILGATLGGERSDEWRRLGQSAAAWILLRGASTGDLDVPALEGALAAFGPSLRRTIERHGASWWEGLPLDPGVQGARLLLPALARAERRLCGRSSSLIADLSAAWFAAPESSDLGRAVTALLAELGDPRAADRVRRWAAADPADGAAGRRTRREWGNLAGWLGDAELTAELRRRCEALDAERGGGADCRADFDAGFDFGELAGIPDNARLDADTLLGNRSGPRDFQPVALAFGGAPAARDGATPAAGARWDFQAPQPFAAGTATGASVRAAGIRRDELGLPYLRFGRFGTSAVRLEFTVPAERTGQPPILTLDHLAARREVYPFLGQAFLDVRVNDLPVVEKSPVAVHHPDYPAAPPLLVPAEYLRPGANVLTIRLHAATTTTYRLLAARLDWPD